MEEDAREIWATVQALNRAWTQGHPADLEGYFHESVQALTPTAREVLDGRAACVNAWTGFCGAVRILRWSELSPRVVRLGSTAVVSYRYELLGAVQGRSVRLEGRDLMVLVQRDGRWWLVADAFGENPPASSNSAPEAGIEAQLEPADLAAIETVWRERWGLPVVTPWATYLPGQVEGLLLTGPSRATLGLVTWRRTEAEAEVVTLDALVEGQGHGSRLMAAAEERLKAAGVRRVALATTNDNLGALAFYCRRGYRVVRLFPDAMDAVRRVKPSVPETGSGGIPLQDMWELEKRWD